MKKSNRESVIGLVIVMNLPLGLAGPSFAQATSTTRQERPVSPPKAPTPTNAGVADVGVVGVDAGVAQAEEHLHRVTVGFNNGVNTSEDVIEAKIALAQSHIRSATDRKKFTGLQQDLETIVTQQQSLLDLANVKFSAGVAGASDLNTAKEILAEARVRLDLYAVLLARQERLSEVSMRQSAGVSSAKERDKATAALHQAERRFVESDEIESDDDRGNL